jgi:hypothetical protein
MIAEALKYLVDLGTQSGRPTRLVAGPTSKTYLVRGEPLTVSIPPPGTADAVHTLPSLIDFIGTRKEPVTVWTSKRATVAVFESEGHRTSTATLEHERSELYRTFDGAKNREYPQADFLRLLRVELAGAWVSPGLLEALRRVQFETGAKVVGEVSRTRESMGREITGAVNAAGELPDTITFRFPMFRPRGIDFETSITCALEINTSRGTFSLVPLPGELEKETARVVAMIQQETIERAAEQLAQPFTVLIGEPGTMAKEIPF